MRALDLFCGACGGWSLGMHRAGYTTAAACEIDPWRRAVFSRNFPNVRMYDDVRSLTADRLRHDLGRVPDIIVGSPPCQDASSANHRGKGVDGERTGLFFEAIRLVAECRPVWGCFENVPGLRTRGVDRVLAELEALGYACWPLVVGAVHAGAPHRRNRVWLTFVAQPAGEQMGRAGQSRRQAERADVPHANGQGQHAFARYAAAMGWSEGDGGTAPEPDQTCGRAAEPTERRGRQPQHDAGQVLAGWHHWNGGAPAPGRVDDGLPRGVARAALAGYGDAVVPAICEIIGRAMMRLLPARAA